MAAWTVAVDDGEHSGDHGQHHRPTQQADQRRGGESQTQKIQQNRDQNDSEECHNAESDGAEREGECDQRQFYITAFFILVINDVQRIDQRFDAVIGTL